jgi:hypothetical protein
MNPAWKSLVVPGGVAVELRVVVDVDAAHRAGGQFVEFRVQDPDFGSTRGPARGLGRRPQVGRCGGGDHAGLGGVVVVVDHVTELVHERGDDVGPHP